MPANKLVLHPPVQYPAIWLIIGSALVVAVAAWYGWLFWYTRRKKQKSIARLKFLPGARDISALRLKYIRMIEGFYDRYQKGELDLRGLHRNFSITIRYFVYETKHFPAHELTLHDLKLLPYPELVTLIGDYYGKEFDVVVHSNAAVSVAAAKEFINTWI